MEQTIMKKVRKLVKNDKKWTQFSKSRQRAESLTYNLSYETIYKLQIYSPLRYKLGFCFIMTIYDMRLHVSSDPCYIFWPGISLKEYACVTDVDWASQTEHNLSILLHDLHHLTCGYNRTGRMIPAPTISISGMLWFMVILMFLY